MKKSIWLFLFCLLTAAMIGCSSPEGELTFMANGESFVRDGFVTVDGWDMQFDSLEVTLQNIAAYQTGGTVDLTSIAAPSGESVELEDTLTVDLTADEIILGSATGATGHYDSIAWEMVNDSDGSTIVMNGNASKDGRTVAFTVSMQDSYQYLCGEFVGDERKGFVETDSPGDVELTFHFDHVFGDADTEADDALNVGAVGFEPFANLATDDTLMINQSELQAQMDQADYEKLVDTVATIGHVGEGHCFEETGGYTGDK